MIRGVAFVIFGLALASCGGNAALEQARAKEKSGDSVGALVDYGRAIKADPRGSSEIKDEAEVLVARLLPAAEQAFKDGKFEVVTSYTTPMVMLPTEFASAHVYDGLARLSIAVRSVPIDVRRFREALAALNGYLTRMPIEARNAQMLCPTNLYTWLTARHDALAKELPEVKFHFGTDFRQHQIADESGGVGGDLGFLLRAFYLQRCAEVIAAPADAPAVKADKIARWVASNLTAIDTSDAGIERPIDVMFAARGTPEQLAWTAVELARQLDVPAFVRIDPAPPGQRELVSFWTGEQWRHLDVRTGVLDDATPPAGARFLIAGEAKSYYPRCGLIQSAIFDLIGRTPQLITRADASLALLLAQVHGRKASDEERLQTALPVTVADKPTIDLYAAPFAVDARLRSGPALERYKVARDRFEAYGDARLLHMVGMAAQSVEKYDQAIARQASDASHRDAAALRAIALADAGSPDAVTALEAFIGAHPSLDWVPVVRLRLGQVLLASGQTERAHTVLAAVDGPRAAFARTLAGK